MCWANEASVSGLYGKPSWRLISEISVQRTPRALALWVGYGEGGRQPTSFRLLPKLITVN